MNDYLKAIFGSKEVDFSKVPDVPTQKEIKKRLDSCQHVFQVKGRSVKCTKCFKYFELVGQDVK